MNNESKEIEVKFIPVNVKVFKEANIDELLDSDDFTLLSVESYKQSYLSEGTLTNRVRIVDDREAFFTCKSKALDDDGLERDEVEFQIPLKEAKKLSDLSIFGLYKDRFKIKHKDGYTLEFDVYKDKLEGLITLEVEFENKDLAKKFKLPSPLSEIFVDVSKDRSYSNLALARDGAPTKKSIKPKY